MHERVVVVIGAGFSGAVVSAHLLTRGVGSRLRVLLVNKSHRMARGLAYGTRSEQHVLNVPAGRMSAFADDPDDFLRFAQRQDAAITGASFVSRQLYGEYLEHVLRRAVDHAAPGAVLERTVGEVRDVALTPDRSRALVTIDGDGSRQVLADRVVLALGNYSPADPRVADRGFARSPRYVRDPWRPGALDRVPRDRPVLLVGTGLTMLDVALDLRSRARTAPMVAVSRRGLVPQAHRAADHAPTGTDPAALLDGPPTVLAYLRAVRRQVRALAWRGVDWRDVLVGLRAATPRLWQRLDRAERARFVRHVKPYWEVHRHRAAPRPAALLARMIDDGELAIVAGRLIAITAGDAELEVALRRRGETSVETRRFGAVVNCTGPCSDVRELEEPLVHALRWRRLLRPDPLGLGVDVDAEGALLDAGGAPSRVLTAVGPLLRARDWEATAVPELREHAARTARRLCAELAA